MTQSLFCFVLSSNRCPPQFSMREIANRQGISQRRVAHLVDLAFLAPDLVQAIMAGRQPPVLSADKLIKSKLPLIWKQLRMKIATL